jgi:hypothetical protein
MTPEPPDDRRPDPQGIDLHDPRLSEWIDGRLPAAEATEMERIVRASPELTQLVADLRILKTGMAGMTASPAPAGFVRDVLAAVDAAVAGRGSDEAAEVDDVEVEAEWRKLERERIEEEIAEAREDAEASRREPIASRWPWLALVGALAAGVLVAIVINRPAADGDREVALTGAIPKRSGEDRRRIAPRPDDGLHNRPVDRANAVAKNQQPPDADAWLPDPASEGRSAGGGLLGGGEGGGRPLTSADAPAPGLEAAEGFAGRQRGGVELAKSAADAKRIAVRIRGPEDRTRLESLVAASGVRIGRSDAGLRTRSAETDKQPKAQAKAQVEGEKAAGEKSETVSRRDEESGKSAAGIVAAARDRIEVSGPPAAIADLVAALGRFEEGGAAQAPAALDLREAVPAEPAAPDRVLFIEIIEIMEEPAGANGGGSP